MDGASSTLGESFVQFWTKLLPLWCKSAVLLVQVPFWCKQQQQSGARVVLPPRAAAVVEAGKVWSKLCQTLSPARTAWLEDTHR